jgi:glycosyltransferase involved in cell wall biosynthesis
VACYGWVDSDSGSGPTANYLLLQELTRRGINVSLFGNPDHVRPPEGMPPERFRYLASRPRGFAQLVESLPETLSWALKRLCAPAVNASLRRTYQPSAQQQHAHAPYDVLLSFLTISPFQVPGVPTVTWLQGPLSTELDAIRRLRSQIVAASGWPFYLALVGLYRYSQPFLRRALRSSTRVVVGSDWSRDALITEGFDPARVHAVPHCVDLDEFRPDEKNGRVNWGEPVILSLGRLDPRKRLDLLLDAFRLVVHEYPGAKLRIVGRPGYARGQLQLIEQSPVRNQILYEQHLPRQEVPELLRGAAVLVQASENENFGTSVAEALACGTPVAVGPSNGTTQYINSTSRVFDSYTPESVARGIISAMRIREQGEAEVRRQTRAAAERWFSPPTVADRLTEVMEAAIAEGRD